MARKSQQANTQQRMEIPYFDGVNSLVSSNISKKQEFSYVLNARSVKIGSIEKRGGTARFGNAMVATANYGIWYWDAADHIGTNNTGMYRIATVSGNTKIYYLNSSTDAWTALSGDNKSAVIASYTFADGCCYIVNGTDDNEYIDINTGTNIRKTQGNLLGSPKGCLINYYKERLYIGDYYNGTQRIKNGIAMSSKPLGIVALVDGDYDAGTNKINVTDIKYIKSSDSLDVYRGATKIGTLTVTSKGEYYINTSSHAFALESSDELWVANTYANNAKVFRWTDNLGGGIDVKEYDSMRLAGGQDEELTMMTNVGDYMVIANRTNMGYWNEYNLQMLDLGIGCVSKKGYIKNIGVLFFLDYSGVYSTSGATPQLISNKVEAYIQGATKSGLENASAGKKGYSVFFNIGQVTLYNPDGSTMDVLNGVTLEYNMRQQNWFVHTGMDAREFATYNADDRIDRLIYADKSGNRYTYEYLTGTMDLIDGEEREILFRVDTDYITLAESFEKICYPQEIIIEIERGNGVEAFVSLDTGSFYKIVGEATKGATILKVTRRDGEIDTEPRCRRLKISLRDFSRNLCKLTRIAFIYTQTSEEEEQRLDTYGG